jgi:multisubunit Na+/H+ antiporter MnhB subunit
VTASAVAAAGVLAAIVGTALVSAPSPAPLTARVAAALPASGVDHPVTAVLLNFRSFDTLLEVGVLVITIMAVRALGERPPLGRPAAATLVGLLRLLAPVALLVGAYLLWIGASGPGGAFQAGAVWAGGLVLAHLAGRPVTRAATAAWPTWLGLGVFVAAALATQLWTGTPMRYPTGAAGAWILAIECAAALSIATILYRLFAAVAPPRDAA